MSSPFTSDEVHRVQLSALPTHSSPDSRCTFLAEQSGTRKTHQLTELPKVDALLQDLNSVREAHVPEDGEQDAADHQYAEHQHPGHLKDVGDAHELKHRARVCQHKDGTGERHGAAGGDCDGSRIFITECLQILRPPLHPDTVPFPPEGNF